MYRYSDKKNKQANQKIRQKRNQRKKVVVKKQAKRKTKRTTSKLGKQGAKQTGKKAVVKKPQKVRQWWRHWGRMGGGLVVMGVLLFATWQICVSSFLPYVFTLVQEKHILLVGAVVEQEAKDIYLVKVLPESKTVAVARLEASMMVPVAGLHGQYPLSRVAQFRNAEADGMAEIRKIYNLALGQSLDEVYFMPDLVLIENQRDLEENLWRLVKREMFETAVLSGELWEMYFTVRSSGSFSVQEIDTLTMVTWWGRGLSEQESLAGCPVSLINAAGTDGLAGRVSQILEQKGFEVRHLDDANEILFESKVFYDQSVSDCVKVVQMVQNTLPKNLEIIADNGEEAKKSRAKAVVYIGQEISD